MSSTTVKNICLSQIKIGQITEPREVTLTHDSTQTDTEIVVSIEVPGVDPSTIDIQCEQNTLHVSCARGTLMLPVDPTSDSSKITADIQWGMLTVRIPLPKPAPTHAIKLNVLDAAKKVAAKPTHKEFTDEE
jgi:HSP20 family molecular chaperone IbpA